MRHVQQYRGRIMARPGMMRRVQEHCRTMLAGLGILQAKLGRPLGYLIFSLMSFIADTIYEYLSKGFRGSTQ